MAVETVRTLPRLARLGQINDHTRMSQQMAATAQAAGLNPPPPVLLPQHQAMLDQLRLVLSKYDLAGARRLFERALAIREARLGADHPDTVRSRERLAAVVAELDK